MERSLESRCRDVHSNNSKQKVILKLYSRDFAQDQHDLKYIGSFNCSCRKSGIGSLNLGPIPQEEVLEIELQLYWQLAVCVLMEFSSSSAFRTSFFCWMVKEIANTHINEDGLGKKGGEKKQMKSRVITWSMCKRQEAVKRQKDRFEIHSNISALMPTDVNCIIAEMKWARILLPLIMQRLNLEYVMACLSTLGGAHSSLGENSKHHAKLAGMMSVKQLAVAAKLNDPILASHCRIYFAHSLIQTGKYNLAAKVIRREYRFCLSQGKSDEKLVTCCKAAWARVRYFREQKKILSQSEMSRSSI